MSKPLDEEHINCSSLEDSPSSREDSPSSQEEIGRDYYILGDLSAESRQKLKLIEAIINASDKEMERRCIKEAALALNLSTKTIKRYRDQVRRDGGIALSRTGRSDKGDLRHVSQSWRDLVLAIYIRGNSHSRRKNRNQVWLNIRGLIKKLEATDLKEPTQLKELFDGYARVLGSAEENSKSKLNKILSALQKEVEVGIIKPPRSHASVYSIVNAYLEMKSSKCRHPGQGSRQIIKTTAGDLEIEHTNYIFQADHTGLDLLLIDENGNEIGYPFLTVVIECVSGCVVGFYLGFEQPGSHEVGLALRHAILPKQYDLSYNLQHSWECMGIPKYLITDRAKEFKSEHLRRIALELGFELRYRAYPSQGGLVESVFDKINKEVLSILPGYKGSNVQKRPVNAQKYACITVEELEKELVRYFCDHYNQHLYPRVKSQTRLERWKAELVEPPRVPEERHLDLCLLKREGRKVQKFGSVRFRGEIYQGECVIPYEGRCVDLLYDPSNIICILAYTKGGVDVPSKFIGILKARDRKEAKLSLKSLKIEQKIIREKGEMSDDSSILDDALERNRLAERKLRGKRKQSRRKEHECKGLSSGLSNVVEFKCQEADQQTSDSPEVAANRPPVKRLKPKGSAKIITAHWHQQLDEW